jgi:hypothetical protein
MKAVGQSNMAGNPRHYVRILTAESMQPNVAGWMENLRKLSPNTPTPPGSGIEEVTSAESPKTNQ